MKEKEINKIKEQLEDSNLEREEKKKKKTVLIILLVLIGIGLIVFLILSFINGWLDPNAKYGNYEGKSQEQIIAELDQDVKDNELLISIANNIKFPEGSDGEGIANIENVSANKLDQKVRIVVDGNTVYESGAIEPGYYIKKIKLNRYFEPGDYKAVAYFSGYNKATHELVGTLASDITLSIS